MPIKIFLYEFINELISKISLNFIFKNDVFAFKNPRNFLFNVSSTKKT